MLNYLVAELDGPNSLRGDCREDEDGDDDEDDDDIVSTCKYIYLLCVM